MTLQALQHLARDLRTAVIELEPERLSGPDAERLLTVFAEIERLAAGGKLLSARRVESSKVWRRTGHRSAAAHLAETTGTGLGPAINTLEAARNLESLPATEDAVRNGRLSETQVKEISDAAILRPDAEQQLVDTAEKQPMSVLRLRCRRVKASGQDQNAAYDAIHRRRYLRDWIDGDGAVRFDARLTPDEGARLIAAVKAQTDRLVTEARRAGIEESRRALAADALVRLATEGGARVDGAATTGDRTGEAGGVVADGTGSIKPGRSDVQPGALVHVRVDHEALVRGHVEPGEVCELPGIGPIPVEVARRLAADSLLHVLVTKGTDVTAVAHAGRTIPAAVRTALLERDPECVVPGCTVREGLEIDHVEPLATGGLTTLDNLVRLCHWHHYLKTHRQHRLEPEGTDWRWITPGEAPSGDPGLQPSARGPSS